MYIYKKLSWIIVIGILGLTNSTAQIQISELDGDDINTITTALPFLMIAPDSRAGGMGDVGVATSPDVSSMHWNPAKFAMIDDDQPMGFSVSYIPWLRALVPDINLAYVTGYYKVGEGQVLASSLRFFSLGTINFTDEIGNPIGSADPHELAFDIAFSQKLGDNFSGAMALRYVSSNLTSGFNVGSQTSHPGRAIAADLSGLYSKDVKISGYNSTTRFGFNISNIGNKVSYTSSNERDFIPINMRLGGGLDMEIDDYNKIGFYVDVNKLLVPTPPIYETDANGQTVFDNSGNPVVALGKNPNVSVPVGVFQSFSDAPGGFSEEMKELVYSVGMEYWYLEQLALRGGYFYEHATKGNRQYFTLGAGLKYKVFGLDFSYLIPTTQNNPLQNTLRFSLSFDFAAIKESSAE